MRVKATVITVILGLLFLCSLCLASVPPMINYQGKLMQPSGVPVPDGTFSMTFAIYGVPTGGTALCSEMNTSVQVKGGLFNVLLGSIPPGFPSSIFDSSSRFLGVKVGSDPEMTPRQQIVSVAFAVRAATVDDGSVTTSKLANGSVTTAWEVKVSQDMTYQDSYVVHAIPGASVVISTTGGSVLILAHLDVFRLNNVSSNHTQVALFVDGVQVDYQWASDFSVIDHVHLAIPITRLITGLSAGNHTVELRSGHAGNAGSIWRYEGYLQCVEMKR